MSEEIINAISAREAKNNRNENSYVYQKELKVAVKKIAQNDAQAILETFSNAALDTAEQIVKLSKSSDEKVSSANAQYIIDHLIGRPTQKSISRVEHANIDILAD